MNERDHIRHVNDLLPAYVLGALEGDEIALVEEHLPTCQTCADDLDALSNVPDELAFAVDGIGPDPAQRARLLERVEREGAGPWPETPAVSPPAHQRRGLLGWLRDRLRPGRPQTEDAGDSLLDIIASPDAALFDLRGTDDMPEARARLIAQRDQRNAVLVTTGLPSLTAGRVYQLWFIAEGEPPVPGMTFQVDARGRGNLVVRAPHALNRYAVIAVTPEPAGGSPGPTGPIVLQGTLASD